MGKIIVKAKIWNFLDEGKYLEGKIKKEGIRAWEGDVLVDTGATMLILPKDIVKKLGVTLGKYVSVRYANGKYERKRVAYGIKVSLLKREGTFDCIVENKGTQVLIGQIVLEELDLVVDPKKGNIGPRPESPDTPLIEVLFLNYCKKLKEGKKSEKSKRG